MGKQHKKRFDIIAHIRSHNGLASEVARACDASRQAVGQWDEVPWNRVLIVEKVTGVPRHKIRPDIYPPKDYAGLRRRVGRSRTAA
jgi:DNA-binding transcriptional regulator YdaS (Cro superfamily)